ncbi:MAG TPA: hypothetical protein VH063_10655 [Gaiellaceae bacterium]|jgi:hypothetical protein|nr:hypothetical protein [Gaiellaceae bacterium]
MRIGWKPATLAGFVVLCLAGASLAAARSPKPGPPGPPNRPGPPRASSCNLGGNADGKIKHLIYIQFDNVHFNSDAPGVPGDLQQMPNLLNFLKGNGTLFTNDHTILISHTAGGILSTMTGLYPDRTGQTVTNSYDYYPPNKVPNFSSSFQYWNAPVTTASPGDSLPNMITDGQKNTPAPWVPFTRAGCDVGAAGIANLELENNSTDVSNVYGAGSTETQESATQKTTDFVGIAVHCSKAPTSVCAGDSHARPDTLTDEPGGYDKYNALFGAKYVDPAIVPATSSNPNSCVPDTEKAAGVAGGGNVTDVNGACGFPGFDGMEANRSLGYVEQMQESGVPVTYAYISDVHDFHTFTPNSGDSVTSSATGPGDAQHEQQLADYNKAFGDFFSNLAAHGINKSNTLFVVTVDEGDHFAGGPGTPDPSTPGILDYTKTTQCTTLASCASNQIGEVDTNIKAVLPSTEPGFDIHFDDAPVFYVNGQPVRTDPSVRSLERDVGDLTSLDPYVKNSAGVVQTVKMTSELADPVELKTLHMINSDPNRTPTFVDFGNPDFFFEEANSAGNISGCPAGATECASPGFAWNHGDIQTEIGSTWAGFVGPGVANNGIDSTTWTDHTNVRPTMMALTGLKDDYEQDGHVLVQALTREATPHALTSPPAGPDAGLVGKLEVQDDLLNAPFGTFARATLASSTFGLESTDDSVYNSVESQIQDLTTQRDALATQIKNELYDAAVNGHPIDPHTAQAQIDQVKDLIAQAAALPSG